MEQKESKFWVWFKDHLPGHVVRVENCIERGMPDVNMCHLRQDIWIELKVEEKGQVKIRKEQYVWAFRRSKEGGRVFCVAKMENGNIQLWRLPCLTRVINDRIQEITGIPDLVVTRDNISDLVQTLFI